MSCVQTFKEAIVTGDTGYKNSDKERMSKMEFLKDVLGEELFKQVETALNAHNGNEANKDNQIKLANLGSGEYVGKGKYDALQALLDGKSTELDTANGLIAELKKGTKGNEELQGKISGYETQVQQLQNELAEIKLKSAIKVALLGEKALDVDYLTYKLENKLKDENKNLELDENSNIKDWNNSGLTVRQWYIRESIAVGTYYNRLRRVRENVLENDIVPVHLPKFSDSSDKIEITTEQMKISLPSDVNGNTLALVLQTCC